MSGHIDETRLNDYLEGLVTEEAARDVEAHLATCEECHDRLATLERLVSEMGDLPDEATPPRDLWPDIRSRMETSVDAGTESEDETVVPLRVGQPSGERRFSFSMRQLLAASIALAFISGGTVWMVLNGGGSRDAGTLATEVARPTNVVPAMLAATTEYEQAIASLESVLDQGKSLLDPETLATIEESLRIIDQAINEARRALAEDPNNDLLNRLLIQNQQSKLRVLRHASAAVQI